MLNYNFKCQIYNFAELFNNIFKNYIFTSHIFKQTLIQYHSFWMKGLNFFKLHGTIISKDKETLLIALHWLVSNSIRNSNNTKNKLPSAT